MALTERSVDQPNAPVLPEIGHLVKTRLFGPIGMDNTEYLPSGTVLAPPRDIGRLLAFIANGGDRNGTPLVSKSLLRDFSAKITGFVNQQSDVLVSSLFGPHLALGARAGEDGAFTFGIGGEAVMPVIGAGVGGVAFQIMPELNVACAATQSVSLKQLFHAFERFTVRPRSNGDFEGSDAALFLSVARRVHQLAPVGQSIDGWVALV
jgi:hypothetical protein